MSNIQWSQEQTMLFLESLQTENIIWDPNDKCHKDKKKMNDAWLRIGDILGGSLPIDELKKKKDSLFATYRGYCRKIQASLKSGAGVDDVYRPVWFAFDLMNSFLGSVFKCKQTIATDQEPESVEEKHDSLEGVVSTASTTSKDQNSIEPSQIRHTTRRRDNPPELQIASKQMTEAFNNLNKIMDKAKDTTEVEDECDVFGKLIAKKLKKLPEHKREDLMFEIHALFQKSRVVRSPSTESFRSSTPMSTSNQSFTPSLSCNTRPKSANTGFYYNAATFSPRPRSAHSEPSNTYISFTNQTNENQYSYIQQPAENTPQQRSAKIRIVSNEILGPEAQRQSVRLHYKRPESEDTGVYGVMVAPPLELSNDSEYMLHIPDTETQADSPDDNTKNNLIYQAYSES